MLRRQLLTAFKVTVALVVCFGVLYPLAVWGIAQLAFSAQANGSLVKHANTVVGSSLIGQSFADHNGNPLPQWFQPRPSNAGTGYDPTASSASNLGPGDPREVGFIPGLNTVGLDGKPSTTNPFATPADPYCVPVDAKSGNPVTSAASGESLARNHDGTYQCDPNTVPERTIAYRSFNHLAPDAPVPIDAVTSSGSGLDPDISVANALDQATRVAQARGLAVAQVTALVRAHVDTRPWGFLGEDSVNVLDLNLALVALT